MPWYGGTFRLACITYIRNLVVGDHLRGPSGFDTILCNFAEKNPNFLDSKKEKLFQEMTSSSSSKKHSPDQPEISGSTTKSLRTKMIKSEDGEKRVMVLCSIQIWTITHFSNHQNIVIQKLRNCSWKEFESQSQKLVFSLL
jgi:hypothetical protein